MAAKKKNHSVDLAPQPDPRASLDGALLLSKAQGLLSELEADLLARARGSAPVREALRARHDAERAARRTADPLEVWERHFVTQVAASWLLSCVFVRTLEDRGLLGHNRIAGPGALDSQRLFFELAPSLTEREYLLTIFRELSRLPAARDLFDARHNPVWMLGPSADTAKKLVALFRTPNADAPGLRFGQADTRFLGDLYQDLSADVRERFALLQTPHFVEKYILDRTLERAIARFGLDETTLIDPTCGSGHFLLGAFERLVDHRLRTEPGLDVREAARRAIDAVYGADINPYAVAIARFRLTLAFLDKAGYARLADAPALPLHLVVADSLLHNPQHAQAKLGELAGQTMKEWGGDQFALEDERAARDVLYRRFAAVVGNPPYITPKDAVLAQEYRNSYPRSASKLYSLGAPFTERFFQLARGAGCVGMITANSFMKREFGRKLIEDFLPTVNLDGVVNTSGAYIPGHGTPTVLLFGTNEEKRGDDVLSVLAKRGEPSTPSDSERGLVWRSIADHGSEVGFENDYISVARVPRSTLEKHPWSLGGGGASELKELLEQRAGARLGELTASIGRVAHTGNDEAFVASRSALLRRGLRPEHVTSFVEGEVLRDWGMSEPNCTVFPYATDAAHERMVEDHGDPRLRWLWPYRTMLWLRREPNGTHREIGLTWYEFSRFHPERYEGMNIAFAEVATHNHFVLDRGGKVFKQSAPIIKLKEGATEEDHLALLAYLNSSVAGFYLRQVCHEKQMMGAEGIRHTDKTTVTFAFNAGGVARLPIPTWSNDVRQQLARIAEGISRFSARRAALAEETARRCRNGDDPDAAMAEAQTVSLAQYREAVGLQEDLDWLVYSLFDLVGQETLGAIGPLSPGERPFEVSLSGRERERTIDGFDVRRPNLPQAAADLYAARQQAMTERAEVRLLEDSWFKRRWIGVQGRFNHAKNDLRGQLQESLINAVLDSIEVRFRDEREPNVTRRMLGSDESPGNRWLRGELGEDCIQRAIGASAVPYLAALRLRPTGMEKRAAWERCWDLQRQEDAGHVCQIEVPPRYEPKDFIRTEFFALRGKLDVPKERFISYPGCESDEDKEPVYGWAGWNHLQQALALAKLYMKRKDEGWAKDRLAPMLAGLLELVPWVKQWHNDDDPDYGGRRGDYFESFLDNECHALGLTREDLRAWRPAEKTKGRKADAKKTAGEPIDSEDGEPRPAPKPRGRKKKAATEATDT